MTERPDPEHPPPEAVGAAHLTPERWAAIKALVHAALERVPAERAAFVVEACGEDAALHREVRSLLAAVDTEDGFLEAPAGADWVREFAAEPPRASRTGEPGTSARARLAAALADRYVIGRELGRGGMATVHLARDLRHGRQVALKVLDPALGAVLGAPRFRREIELAASLQHPHIVPVFDSGETPDGDLWYTMPFVAGESLRDRLRREGVLSVPVAVALAREIAAALDHAHRRGVVHRDVKPENVLLNEDRQALVTDFGIARRTTEGADQRLTRHGLLLGTPGYVSPEQGAGGREVDGRADQYALGCLLFEALTGQPPYDGPSAPVVIGKHVSEPVPDLRAARADVPPAVAAAVARAMAKAPEERFASAGAFASALADGAAARARTRTPATIAPRARWRAARVHAAAGAVVVLSLTGLAMSADRWRERPGQAAAVAGTDTARRAAALADSAATAGRSIAVLPFQNLSASRDDEYFSDGITEDLLVNLSRITHLRVISRTSVMRYKDRQASVPDIASQLGVAYVLEGSVRRVGDRVRVTVQLIDAGADAPVWSETYDRELEDVFEIQSEVAGRIARALRAHLPAEERDRIAAAPTTSLAAFDLYLLGRHYWNRRTPEGFRAALAHFRRAIQLDPGYTRAYAGLADTYVMHALWSLRSYDEVIAHARQAASMAVELDGTSVEAHTSLAQVHVLEWDWRSAERAFRRALSLGPSHATAVHWYGQFLMYMGRCDEAIRIGERARAIDPLSPIVNADLAQTYLEARRFAQAEAQFLHALRLDSTSTYARHGLAQTYERTGRPDEALELYEEVRDASGEPSLLLAGFHARHGRREEARRLLGAAMEHRRRRGLYIRPVPVARVLVALGETDEAFEWLERGYVEHDPFMVILHYSSDFDAIRDDPRFAELVRRMSFPWPVDCGR